MLTSHHALGLLLFIFIFTDAVAQLNVGIFFPYGLGQGDLEVVREDDNFTGPIVVPDFPYFGHIYNDLYVNTNGLLSFVYGIISYTPNPFPISSQPAIAVFWADVDTRNGGNIFYRQVVDTPTLNDITQVILAKYSERGAADFQATWAFIATYAVVPPFGGGPERNTFQVVIATDGAYSFAIYHYGDLEWSYGSQSGQTPAQVGFDAGDGVNFLSFPESRTADITHINADTNVNVIGRWIFRIDQPGIDNPADFRCSQGGVCEHGTCMMGSGNERCDCDPGFTGLVCDEFECDQGGVCKNGECKIDQRRRQYCQCHRGYIGLTCSEKRSYFDCRALNPCKPVPVFRGQLKYAHTRHDMFVGCTSRGRCHARRCPKTMVWDQAKNKCIRTRR